MHNMRIHRYFKYILILLILFIFTIFISDKFNIININLYNYPNKPNKTYHFLYFGTVIQVSLSPDENNLPNKAIDKIDATLKKLHYKWHPWRDGELKDLNNKLASLKEFTVNREIIDILNLSKDLYKNSLGYFNPAIGKLVGDLGFHTDNPSDNPPNNLLENTNNNSIQQQNFLKNIPNPSNILILDNNKNLIKNTNPNLKLDLSGFIKADAMLKIKDILIKYNINNSLINIGGDIYVMGNKYNNINNWVIAVKYNADTKSSNSNINNPNINNSIIKLKLYDQETIATSGVYARYTNNNLSNHHIINPKTGYAAKGFYSVTVISKNPYLSDSAATAILAAGPKDYKTVISSMNIDKYIIITDNKNLIISDKIKTRIIPQ